MSIDRVPAQIPLPIRLRPSSVYASFCVGENQQILEQLQTIHPIGCNPVVFLSGPQGGIHTQFNLKSAT